MTTTPITPSVRIYVSTYDAALCTDISNAEAAGRYAAAIQTAYPTADVSIVDGWRSVTVRGEDADGSMCCTDRIEEHCRRIIGTVWMQLRDEAERYMEG